MKRPERKDFMHPHLQDTVKQPEYTEALEAYIDQMEKMREALMKVLRTKKAVEQIMKNSGV